MTMRMTDSRAIFQDAMRAAFPAAEQRVQRFYAMLEYHLGWRDADLEPASFDPGKLLRPRLVLLACQAVGGDMAQAVPLAAGIQLIHDFSLIHDDIEDNSDTRRGRITVWKQWGLEHGINVGDGMFVISHLSLLRMADAGVAPAVIVDVLRRFEYTILAICEGQFLDLSFEGDLTITEGDYIAMIARKTSALIAAATGLGAVLGGADANTAQTLSDFGQHLGLAFQVQDDILGIWGDPQVTGKPYAADIYRRKVSLPVVHALSSCNQPAGLRHLYRQESLNDTDVEQVLAILDSAGSYGYCEQVALHHHTAALAAIDSISAGDSTDARAALGQLRAIAEGLLGRQS